MQIINGYFNNSLKKEGSIGDQAIAKIVAKFPDLNLYWLISGHGEMMHPFMHPFMRSLPERQNEMVQKMSFGGQNEMVQKMGGKVGNQVYIIEEAVRGGVGKTFSEENIKDLESHSLPWLGSGFFYVFSVRGDSMYPTLCNGDKVFTRQIKGAECIKNGEIYVWLTDTGLEIKRYSHQEDEDLILLSDNEETYPKPIKLDSKRIKGVFEVVERNTSNLGKNQQLKLYKTIIELHGIKI